MPQTILIVDDEKRLVSLVQSYLIQEGYRVVTAHNGRDALTIGQKEKPDLIILDIMMPEMNGYDFMRIHRIENDTPIILLTAKVDDDDKVIGLELGADDYVTKPFKPRELMARVRNVLRRTGKNEAKAKTLRAGEITLNRETREVLVADNSVDLTPSEFDLLAALMTAPGRVFSRLDLLDVIQGVRYEGYERTIDTHVKNLRAKIETDPRKPRNIETVYGVGYRFKGLDYMRSISTKLILAFLSIGVISIAVIFISARWNTRQEFINFLSDQSQTGITTELSEYHRINGSWDGVETIFSQNTPPQQPDFGPVRSNRRMPFTLTDENGIVIISSERYKTGDKIPEADFGRGLTIMEDKKVIGILIPAKLPFQGNPREIEFIERTNLTLLYGALFGAIIAFLLGIFLSRTITHPIRELTQATQAVAEGDLSQQVPVRSNDELGDLARAFNKMSMELQRSVNARKQMTADIAHELRTPLSLILGHAEAVHDGVLPSTHENFEIIREEAARLNHLVEDLRTLSLADTGELSLEFQPVDINKLLSGIKAHMMVQINQKRVTLNHKPAPDILEAAVDPVRISQVLMNILDNALRYTPQGGQIILSTKQLENEIEIIIEDSGEGVNSDEAAYLFDRFYRADISRNRDEGGSGLGLAIAKSIIEMHKGKIWVESEKGRGMRVIIQLPVPK